VALEPSTRVEATLPLGQAVLSFQLITAERAACVAEEAEHVKGLEAKVPSSCGEPKLSTIPELVVQPDRAAWMEDPVPPPDAASGGVKVTVPERAHVAALPVMVCMVAVGVPMEIVPESLADLRPLWAHAEASVEGFSKCTTAVPGNDPAADPFVTVVGAIAPLGTAAPRHLMVADSAAPCWAEEEHAMGLALKEPRSRPEETLLTVFDAYLHPDNVADTRDALLPPLNAFNGGEKRTAAEREQVTEPVT
jgi:hypothetical protein